MNIIDVSRDFYRNKAHTITSKSIFYFRFNSDKRGIFREGKIEWACFDDFTQLKEWIVRDFISIINYRERRNMNRIYIKNVDDLGIEIITDDIVFKDKFNPIFYSNSFEDLDENVKAVVLYLNELGYKLDIFISNNVKNALSKCSKLEEKYNCRTDFKKSLFDIKISSL